MSSGIPGRGAPGGPARPNPSPAPAANPAPSAPAPAAAPAAAQPRPTQPAPNAASTPAPVSRPDAATSGVRVTTTPTTGKPDINRYLTQLVKAGGSDLHLAAGGPPFQRINGSMQAMPNEPVLTADALNTALTELVTPSQRERFEKERELDFAYSVPNVGRFRGNLHVERHQYGAVFRHIPSQIKPLESLGLPPVINMFAGLTRGLVLVTGPTGSGKTTTLAALIDQANRTRAGHIITVEDPIEFLHDHRSSIVKQREVGDDTLSFSEALKHALRQDPDIILVGEMRDLETISIALTAAETGHLVLATLHTQSAQDTINRIVDVFPGNEQPQIRAQVAGTLRGVVCQSLVKARDGSGRVPACEILVNNTAIAQMIRMNQTHQIPSALQSGGAEGMQTLNQHLAELVADGTVSRETAEEYITDSRDFDALLQGAMTRTRKAGRVTTGL